MKYSEIVKSSLGGEEQMWDSVSNVSSFIEKVRESHPELVSSFLEEQYVKMNGRHINEHFAKKIVSEMFHTDKNDKRIEGELVSFQEAQELLNGKSQEKSEKMQWDAYVAANAFMHDLADVGLSKSDTMRLAKVFWFQDEDMDKCHKVYWYFMHKQF